MLMWTVNLTTPDPALHQQVDLPVPPLFATSGGVVGEVVFWASAVQRWVHMVSAPFQRELPPGHVQVTAGDLVWIERVVAREGLPGLCACVHELETAMIPEDA